MKIEPLTAGNSEIDISNCTVLLVDDDTNLLHSLARALRQQPYKVMTAISAEEAMSVFRTHCIDAIVSDENMPGISGTKFLAWVADIFPEVTRIMLTGQPTVPLAMSAINEGKVYRYFTKPCDMEALAKALRQGLEENHLDK